MWDVLSMVRETLTSRRAVLEALAKLLTDKEVVAAESLRALLGDPAPRATAGR